MNTIYGYASRILALLTVIADAGILSVAILGTLKKGRGILKFLGENAFILGCIAALGGLLGSIFYSNVIGFLPCQLCWIQRLFLIPLIPVLGIQIWKHSGTLFYASIHLSLGGMAIAAYHSYLQYGGDPLLPCAASGISCVQRLVFEFGYVTIPIMSLTGFLLIFTLLMARWGHEKSLRNAGVILSSK